MKTCRVLDEEDHPVVGSHLLDLRDVERQRDRYRFRRSLKNLGRILGYEAARLLPVRRVPVTTPLGLAEEPVLERQPVLAAVLRASLPLWDGLLEIFPEADSLVIGASRREGSLQEGTLEMEVDLDYSALVSVEGRPLVYADPMIATGSTLRKIHPVICARAGKPSGVIVLGVVAYRLAMESLRDALDADVIVASADDHLDERGYIVPGLGDAGDLALGVKI